MTIRASTRSRKTGRRRSSVAAFELSCERLLKKLLAFLEVHSEMQAEKKRLGRWKTQNSEILSYAIQRHLDFWSEDRDESDGDNTSRVR